MDYDKYVKMCKTNPYSGNVRKTSWFFICFFCRGNGCHCDWCPWLAHEKDKQEAKYKCSSCRCKNQHHPYCSWKQKYDPEPRLPMSMLARVNHITTSWKPESFDNVSDYMTRNWYM